MSGRPVVIAGLHFGAIELPVVLLAHLVGHRVTAPMEAVSDPGVQRWFVTTRSRVGVDIVPLQDARRAMLRALRRGESVGMVIDRDLTHTGIPVPFFGVDTPMSPGPALLAIEARVPVYAASARRLKGGRYAAKLIEVPIPVDGTRRERVVALTREHRGGLRDDPRRWPRAVVGRVPPDLAGPGRRPGAAAAGARSVPSAGSAAAPGTDAGSVPSARSAAAPAAGAGRDTESDT